MHVDERADIWNLSNPGGFAVSQQYPARTVALMAPDQVQPGQGVQAAGDGVIPVAKLGEFAAQRLILKPLGIGGQGQTFSMAVYSWTVSSGREQWATSGQNPGLWMADLLATFNVTLGNIAVPAGSDLLPGALFANTIVQSYGPSWITGQTMNIVDEFLLTPGTGGPNGANTALISLRILGARFVEITFQLNGTASGANCLYRRA